MQELKLKVSSYDVFKIVAVVLGTLLGLFFLYFIKDLIIILFVSFVFAAALNPTVNYLEKKRKFPRAFSVLSIYLIFLAIFALIMVSFIPLFIDEFGQLIQNFSLYSQKIPGFQPETGLRENFGKIFDYLNAIFGKTGKEMFLAIFNLFGGLGYFIFILIITFYLVIAKNEIKRLIYNFTPIKYQEYILPFISRAQEKIGFWFKGQLILCFIIGLISYIGLLIIGTRFALVLALFAGLTEIIPYIGPWIGGVLAVIITLFQSPFKALMVGVLYLLIQQLENAFIVPRVMHKVVGLNPIIIICSLWIGGKIGGILGMLVAVPAAGAISILIKDFLELKKHNFKLKEPEIKVD